MLHYQMCTTRNETAQLMVTDTDSVTASAVYKDHSNRHRQKSNELEIVDTNSVNDCN